ncbi:MAG: transglutaminase domain-containing protein [Anaerolineales bacterium]|nr:transglutaminase domain-containing protein [Anaerolineales bacterium]
MTKVQDRHWDTPAAIIVLIAILFSAWRLQAADWLDELGRIASLSVAGYVLGLALGYSRFQKRGVIRLAFGYMVVIFIWFFLGAISFDKNQIYLWDRLVILFGRLFTDLRELLSGRALEDQLFLFALLCIPYWIASLYSGYHLTRHADYLKVILPNGILMLIAHVYHYTGKDYTWMFGIYLFLALILLGRLKYLADRKEWLQTRVQFSSESGLDITNTTVAVAVVLVFLAWVTPYILPTTEEGRKFWQNTYGEVFSSERFENLFAPLNKEIRPVARNFQTQLALGTSTPQGENVIFQVHALQSTDDLPRLYWRGQIYDRFEYGAWQTTSQNEAQRKSSDSNIKIPDNNERIRASFTFDVFQDQQILLYTAAQPVWVNRDSIMLYSDVPSQDDKEDPLMDVTAIRASPTLESGDVYLSIAMLADPTIAELRDAGEEYPDWVTEKYLQLPDDFSPRILELAQNVTKFQDNPYDKAAAITSYLRREIKYVNKVSFPAGTTDALDYVLFEGKEGFCNYSASAEVLMLRAVGIPARLAVGYAQGESNLQNNLFVVRERDFHAWPEVYFPEYGWVEFEPTGNQNPLERPKDREDAPVVAPAINPGAPLAQPDVELDVQPDNNSEGQTVSAAWVKDLYPFLPWLGGVFLVLLTIVMKRRFAPKVTAASIVREVIVRTGWTPPRWLDRWLQFAFLSNTEKYFHRVNLSLRWLKHSQPPHVTARERADVLKELLPEASVAIDSLLAEHQAQLFSPHGGDEALARKAAREILYKAMRRRLKFGILGYNYLETQ